MGYGYRMAESMVIEERFFDKVMPVEDGCHLWTACVDPEGYGQFRSDTKVVRAHRFAYELAVGPIPDGLFIDHLCRVRSCVNPKHLEPVTHRENMRRAAGDYCKAGHKRTYANIQWVFENGKRRPRCKPCGNKYTLAWYHKTKANR